ncbi:dihydrodipicolinate synthase family protein, partial [Pseudomonas aeruginosa]
PTLDDDHREASYDAHHLKQYININHHTNQHRNENGPSTAEYYPHTPEEPLAHAAHPSEDIPGRLPLLEG